MVKYQHENKPNPIKSMDFPNHNNGMRNEETPAANLIKSMEDHLASLRSEETNNETLPALTFQPKNETPQSQSEPTQSVQCLRCDNSYMFPRDKDDYLAHLFLEHRLVIADVEEIALLDEYLKCWHNDFKEHSLQEYCTTMLLDQLPDGTPATNEKYYLLSDLLPRDAELRRRLRQQRLERALQQHQLERTDRTFTKECLYCRDVISGLRADYLKHLYQKHFVQLGNPEKLVYVDELLAKLQANLDGLVCLYCEKIFKDRVTLKEHMRKKAHKCINPENHAYDRFFLINYHNERPAATPSNNTRTTTTASLAKQLPRRTKRLPAKEQSGAASTTTPPAQQRRPRRASSDEGTLGSANDFERRFAVHRSDDGGVGGDSDSDWSDWADEQPLLLNCLFCPHRAHTYDAFKQHLLDTHLVDFAGGVQPLHFYQRIKAVNYVRRQVCLQRCVTCNVRCGSAEALLEHMTAEGHFGLGSAVQWDKPEYYFPTYEDDNLLCMLDDLSGNAGDEDDKGSGSGNSLDGTAALADGGVRIISEDSLVRINKDAERLILEDFPY